MAIEKVRDFFGVKYLIPYDLTSRVPKLILRVVQEFSYEIDIDTVDLTGGDTEAPWDREFGQPTPNITGTVREYPVELFSLVETSTVTKNVAEVDGSIGAISNGQGTTVFDAVNGIDAVTVKTAVKGNLRHARYVFVATAATTIDIYVVGLYTNFLDIQAKAVETVSIAGPGPATVDVDELGITISIAGTPNFTTGDTAFFEVRPENTGSEEVIVGTGTTPQSFGCRCVLPKKTDGVLHFIDIFNIVARALPWQATSREFSETTITWGPLARSSDGAIYEMHRVLGV